MIAGTWRGKVSPDTQPIPISLEKSIAENLGVITPEVEALREQLRIAVRREIEKEARGDGSRGHDSKRAHQHRRRQNES